MADAWLKELADVDGLDPILRGGEGVDHDDPPTPETPHSGYRKADALVHAHYWLLVGPGRHVFDPTAHQRQFTRGGPIRLYRYVIEGLPLPNWRRESR